MVDDEDPIVEFSEGTDIDWRPGQEPVRAACGAASAKKGGKKSNKPDTSTERTPRLLQRLVASRDPGRGRAAG